MMALQGTVLQQRVLQGSCTQKQATVSGPNQVCWCLGCRSVVVQITHGVRFSQYEEMWAVHRQANGNLGPLLELSPPH